MDPAKVTIPEGDDKSKALESDLETSLENPIEKTPTQKAMDFPDGGAKAWSVAIGAACVLFCTFGYANTL